MRCSSSSHNASSTSPASTTSIVIATLLAAAQYSQPIMARMRGGTAAFGWPGIDPPHLPCVLQHVRVTGENAFLKDLRLHLLCAPHLEVGGAGNNGHIVEAAGEWLLAAEKGGLWLALGASVPLTRLSCGYAGRS